MHWELTKMTVVDGLIILCIHIMTISDGRRFQFAEECFHKGKFHGWKYRMYPPFDRILSPSVPFYLYFYCLCSYGFLRKICLWHHEVLSKQWYTAVLARIHINAFRIELAGGLYEDLLSSAAASVEAEAAVGNAVYMLPSFYNHDCGKL